MRDADNASPMGARILAAREAAKMSQSDVAAACGYQAQTQWRYENGRAEPRAVMLARLAEVLGVRMEWLATGKGPMREPARLRATGTEGGG